ncbi:hypothetical protein DTO271D3_3962 [Paecilomyces variotii]|nr:hypothetical protein DTO169E5_1746 [Paecilomyces variotii]KAJ9315706.1 hypothetical protein DTO271D3_3962 [Paecilomyces variotii]
MLKLGVPGQGMYSHVTSSRDELLWPRSRRAFRATRNILRLALRNRQFVELRIHISPEIPAQRLRFSLLDGPVESGTSGFTWRFQRNRFSGLGLNPSCPLRSIHIHTNHNGEES